MIWFITAWDKLDKDMIKKYRVSGLSVKTNGSEVILIIIIIIYQGEAAMI